MVANSSPTAAQRDQSHSADAGAQRPRRQHERATVRSRLAAGSCSPECCRWLAKRPRATTIPQLQAQLDAFTGYSNTHRPHRALGRRTPAAAYAARPKATPLRPGFVAPAHYRVRHDKADTSGVITLRHNSRLHHIGLGRRHAGTRVLVLVAALDLRVLSDDGQPIREFTLDPSRDYQRQHRP